VVEGMGNFEECYKFFKGLDRRLFLDENVKGYASLDRPISIGYGQTCSQPTLVLQMTVILDINSNHKVLEIGTGSGYQTAFLANFSKEVYTVELIEELSKKARIALEKMGYKNIHYKIADGSIGWESNAPYDRIMVTAAAAKVPDELVEQLANGGKMIIPIGNRYSQVLALIEKDEEGKLSRKNLESVIFVEFKGKYGF